MYLNEYTCNTDVK